MKFLYLAGAVLCAAVALRAQTNPAPLMSGSNAAFAAKTNSPMEIRSTEIQCSGAFWASTKSNVAVYTDSVRVDNPQMKLQCELLIAEAPKWTNGAYNRVTAETNVIIDWIDEKGATNHATSDKAVYTYMVTNLSDGLGGSHFQTNSTVVLSGGNPTVTDASGTIRGDPINFDRVTGVISTPNLHNMLINNPPKTNSPNLFQTSGLQPPKTNAPK